MTAPAVQVPAPKRVPHQGGLFSVLNFVSGDSHWESGGIEFRAPRPGAAGVLPGYDCAPGAEQESPDLNLPDGFFDVGEGVPFTVYDLFKCSPVGTSETEARELAIEALEASEQAAVEKVLWEGGYDLVQFLADPEATALPEAADLLTAIGEIEQWAAETLMSQPVLHMSRRMAIHALDNGGLKMKDGVIRTGLGSPVVAGAGYPDVQEIKVTGGLIGLRSEIFAASEGSSSFDTKNNDLYYVPQRTYALGFDPAAQATINVTKIN